MKNKLFWSQYNYLKKSDKHGYLIYNTETNNFAKLPEESFNQFQQIELNNELIETLNDDFKETLKKQRILVEDKKSYLYRRRMKYNFQAFDTSNLGLAVAPTTSCNFICPYCYEGEKKHVTMNEETELNLLNFIDSHKRTNTLNLTWYGGEPLMGFSSIQRILEGIKNINHIKLGLHNMPTNGYLLNKDVSLFFKEHPMDSIQITIDGAKEHHDTLRMLPGNLPTFDRIIQNIDTFMDYNSNTEVFIRMNLSHENINSYGDTYLKLMNYWKGRKLSIYPAFVKDFSESCKTNCLLVKRDEKLDFFIELKDKYDIDVNFNPYNQCTGLCGATLINYYVVGPEGEMYKCWNDLGVKDRIVGYLDIKEPTNYDLTAMYLAGPNLMDDPQCIDCKILPICTGGCLWVRHKNLYENKEYDYSCCTRKNNIERMFDIHYEQVLQRKIEKKI